MAKTLDVLILDDVPEDAELLVHQLQRHGFTPEWRRVETAEEFRSALAPSLDVILADYSLPAFSGLRALDLLKDSGLDVPLLIVSGAIGEEAGVEAMRRGAADFILKDRLGRLGPAIDRALQDRRQQSEKRRVEQALRESEQRYRTLVESAEDAIFIVGAGDLRFEFLNRAALEGLGRHDDVHGKRLDEVFPPGVAEYVIAANRRVLSTGKSSRLEERIELPGQGLRWLHTVLAPLFDGAGSVTAVIGMSRDITEIKWAEEALRESERHYRLLFEANPLPMVLYDADTLKIMDVNDAMLEKYGFSRDEFLNMTVPELHAEEDLPRLRDLMAGPRPALAKSGPWKHRRKDGTWIDVEIFSHALSTHGRPTRLALANDITEQKQLEERYRQAQKMEAIGRLAGGIAHDFNNLLTAILGYSDLAIEELGDHPVVPDLEEVRKAGEQAKELTQQLLAFSRRQIVEPRVIDVNDVLRGMEKMLRRLIGEDIVLTLDLQRGAGFINIDPGQIHQIIMNLAVNARDAMADGGALSIATKALTLAAEHLPGRPEIVPGPYLVLTVSDTGCGMPPEVQRHLFEPFFTTKESGKGTGLGLATVYGIVKQSGGYVWATSEVGRGTAFTLHFPLAAPGSEVWAPAVSAARGSRGTETILVIEDNEQLRNLASRTLRQAGYTVLAASDGKEAVRIGEAFDGPIDLVFTDVVMPGVSGSAAFALLVERRPGLKVLYTSGHADDSIVKHGVLDKGIVLLPKPYTATLLIQKVREVLDSAPA